MKPSNLIVLYLRAGLQACQAWNLFGAQNGYRLSMDHKPLPPLAAKARELAIERGRQSDLFKVLDGIYPLGYAWTYKWERRAAA